MYNMHLNIATTTEQMREREREREPTGRREGGRGKHTSDVGGREARDSVGAE